jgi:hypothetical protein
MATISHSLIPRRGKPVARAKISTAAQALDYAAAGFHVCVDRANAASGSTQAAWVSAGQAYAASYESASVPGLSTMLLSPVVAGLAAADSRADAAARVTAVSAGKPPPPQTNPLVPPTEQPGGIGGGGGFMEMQVGGIPIWLLAAPLAVLAYNKFTKKGGGRRRRRR